MTEPKYPRELIARYRAQDFRREIVRREVCDLDYDELTLSCGHTREMDADLVRALGDKFLCRQCRKEWLAKEGVQP